MRRARSVLLFAVLALACGVTVALPSVAAAAGGQTILADFNNDGITDALVMPAFRSSGTCTIQLELGDGSGGFGAPTFINFTPPAGLSGECPNNGAAVKLGNDTSFDIVGGFPDLGSSVTLALLNQDNGASFVPGGVFPGVIEPDFVRTGDLNGDGRQDIILGSNQVNELTTLTNNADGTLTRGPISTCAFRPQYALADFNGDGGQDILLSDICPPSQTPVSAQVFFGNGQAPVTLFSTTNFNAQLTVFSIDLNFDGIPDAGVIETVSGTTTVMYFLNDGHGNFTPFTGNTAQGNTVKADLNNDGIPDMVTLGQVGDTTTCTLTLQRGTAAGTFQKARTFQYQTLEKVAPFCPNIGVAVTLGTQRKPSLVTSFSFGFRDMMVIRGHQARKIFQGIIQPDFIRAADFNGDGRQDVIEGGSEEDQLANFTNNANGTLTPGAINVCERHHGVGPDYVLADFNGDGGQDMLLSHLCLRPEIDQAEVQFGNGQAPAVLEQSADGTDQYAVFALDTNYDGIPDAGVIDVHAGTTTVRLFTNDGHGNFS